MMNKSFALKLLKYLLALPFVFLLLTTNSCTNNKKQSEESAETTVIEEIETLPRRMGDAVVAVLEEGYDDVYMILEYPVEYVGGTTAMVEFLNNNIQYPIKAKKDGVEGRVVTRFIVEKDGSLSDVQIFRGVDSLLNAEAIRVVKSMPKWKPGRHDGENRRMRVMLPIVFRLQQKGEEVEEIIAQAEPVSERKEIGSTDIYVVVEKQPEFPEGNAAMMKFLSDNINYPAEAQKKGIQGRVTTNFVVEKDGSLTDVTVVRGTDPLLDAEAVRVIQSMPKWKPGTQKGQKVRVRYTLPVVFRLQQ